MTSAIDGFSDAMRAREEAARIAIRREGMAEGYREGVSDGLKLAASQCDKIRDSTDGSAFFAGERLGAAACAATIRELIQSTPAPARPPA